MTQQVTRKCVYYDPKVTHIMLSHFWLNLPQAGVRGQDLDWRVCLSVCLFVCLYVCLDFDGHDFELSDAMLGSV